MAIFLTIMVILVYKFVKFVISAAAQRTWPSQGLKTTSRHTQCEVEEGCTLASSWQRVWLSSHGEKFHLSPDCRGLRTPSQAGIKIKERCLFCM